MKTSSMVSRTRWPYDPGYAEKVSTRLRDSRSTWMSSRATSKERRSSNWSKEGFWALPGADGIVEREGDAARELMEVGAVERLGTSRVGREEEDTMAVQLTSKYEHKYSIE